MTSSGIHLHLGEPIGKLKRKRAHAGHDLGGTPISGLSMDSFLKNVIVENAMRSLIPNEGDVISLIMRDGDVYVYGAQRAVKLLDVLDKNVKHDATEGPEAEAQVAASNGWYQDSSGELYSFSDEGWTDTKGLSISMTSGVFSTLEYLGE